MDLDTIAGGGFAGLASAAGLFVGFSAAWERLIQPLREEIATARTEAAELRAEIAALRAGLHDLTQRVAVAEERGQLVRQRLEVLDGKLDRLLEILHARPDRTDR
jgi:chromosome segregation ATPase